MKTSTVLWTILIIVIVVLAGWWIYSYLSENATTLPTTASQTQDVTTDNGSGDTVGTSPSVTTVVSSSTVGNSTTVSTTTVVNP